jgi:TfoX/Sxy family transcriptional regulator of competence genes
MDWQKAPEELVEFLALKMKNVDCQFRKMFGYPTYFINGNLFVGIHGEKIFLRLSESDIKKIGDAYPEVSGFEPMPGRAMKGYVVLPKSVYVDEKVLAELLDRSLEYASSLPPKQGKKQQVRMPKAIKR